MGKKTKKIRNTKVKMKKNNFWRFSGNEKRYVNEIFKNGFSLSNSAIGLQFIRKLLR